MAERKRPSDPRIVPYNGHIFIAEHKEGGFIQICRMKTGPVEPIARKTSVQLRGLLEAARRERKSEVILAGKKIPCDVLRRLIR